MTLTLTPKVTLILKNTVATLLNAPTLSVEELWKNVEYREIKVGLNSRVFIVTLPIPAKKDGISLVVKLSNGNNYSRNAMKREKQALQTLTQVEKQYSEDTKVFAVENRVRIPQLLYYGENIPRVFANEDENGSNESNTLSYTIEIMEMLRGKDAGSLILAMPSPPNKENKLDQLLSIMKIIGRQLAAFHYSLYTYPTLPTQIGLLRCNPNTAASNSLEWLSHHLEYFKSIWNTKQEANPPEEYTLAEELLEKCKLEFEKNSSNFPLVLVHGDAMLPNFIVDDFIINAPTVTGMIDLGDCGVGDARYDLGALFWSVRYNCEKNSNLGTTDSDITLLFEAILDGYHAGIPSNIPGLNTPVKYTVEMVETFSLILHDLYDVIAYDIQ
ncbi:hypothetical protein HK103_002351 [Boothiomyces macroporosus]|uniref:Aminoglycoside phosphotransferase domain-containing protein n=1 Tax=Boothiomyces macroporosus TaxID=261099 RepID=A0AAD5Y4U4_9FUNG|nr:hypothetical protein HK103_002351 [Boothiomyces macroporosus]